tara:strand:- start:1031 stop:1156 length:126 start_codon:yes stop_codon:yes gene_type:complete
LSLIENSIPVLLLIFIFRELEILLKIPAKYKAALVKVEKSI